MTEMDNAGQIQDVAITETEVIVLGTPADGQSEESGHNCDSLGCGSVGPHVLWRGSRSKAEASGSRGGGAAPK